MSCILSYVQKYLSRRTRRLPSSLVVRFHPFIPLDHLRLTPQMQEHPFILFCLAIRHTYTQAHAPPLESTFAHHLRSRLHPIWILFRYYENLRPLHIT